MKIQDMILVIQNSKGSETNMLMTLKEPSLCYSIVIPYPCECIASFLDKRYKQYWFMLIPSRLD